MSARAKQWIFLLATLPGVAFIFLPFAADTTPLSVLQLNEVTDVLLLAIFIPHVLVVMGVWEWFGGGVHRSVLTLLCACASCIYLSLVWAVGVELKQTFWDGDSQFFIFTQSNHIAADVVGIALGVAGLLVLIRSLLRGVLLRVTSRTALMGTYVAVVACHFALLFGALQIGAYLSMFTAAAFLFRTIASLRRH